MSEALLFFFKMSSMALELIGILIILAGSLLSLGRFILKKQGKNFRSFQIVREEMGRGILLGLEFLVAADIIATVIFDSSMEQILKLAIIILIRTFLSFALEIEIEGKLPWKQSQHKTLGKK